MRHAQTERKCDMPYCQSCGTQSTAKFCAVCGATIGEQQPRAGSALACPKCKSKHVSVQTVTTVKSSKRHRWPYWVFFIWLLDLLLWIFLFIPRLIIQAVKPAKISSKTHSEAVCQNCGKR